ncbi:MAG TPA: adenylate/guanylate cyclase domain-containing protein [Gemmatimonadota bacterium]|nr:adenylate/guanylate cyclase domain-containing protein [Gemmatimonadota bacterium]
MRSRRSLATILFTDIVGSTERATELGDRAWRELQERHHAAIRGELARWGGREVTEAGDGFLALFDQPARATVCAHAIVERVRELGLEVRCGVHMGQVERAPDGSAGGIAVHVGARVAARAGPSEVLVTSAVRDAEAGSGFAFEDLGPHELKGVDRPWQLFRVTALPDDARALAPGAWERLRHRIGPRRAAAVGTLALVLLAAGYAAYRATVPEEALASGIRSLAVLPLEDLSGDPGQEYFADGMTEALITELSKIGAVKVISRRSVMRYKGTETSMSDIAEELGVDGVIEGSVVRDGDRVRITAQLIHGGSDVHLWAESYEGTMADVLVLQSTIARDIARAIEVALSPEAEARLADGGRVDPEAYEAYLRGVFHLQRFTEGDMDTALGYFERAIEIDSTYAPAWVGLGKVWQWRGGPKAENRAHWEPALERALELDPDLAEAHYMVATVRAWGDWDWEEAERAFQRAIELDPGFAEGRVFYGHLLSILGRWEEAAEQTETGLALDPLNPFIQGMHAAQLVPARRDDEAIERLRAMLRSNPGAGFGRGVLAATLRRAGRHEGALREWKTYYGERGRADVAAALDRGYREGGYAAAYRHAADALAAPGRAGYEPPIVLAVHYLHGEDKEKALYWLERAVADRDGNVPYMGVLPDLEPLHDHPRFRELARRVGVPILNGPGSH